MDLRIRALNGGEHEEARASASEAPISFLQSEHWGRFKSAFGWSPLSFELEAAGRKTRLLVLVRRLPARFSFAYVPHGPALDTPAEQRAELLAALAEALRPSLPRRCLFIRFDPPWYEVEARDAGSEGEAAEYTAAGCKEIRRPGLGYPLRRAAYDVQPPDTVLVDLGPSEEAILAAMKPKWRYNIRLADKKGVVVEEAGAEALPEFYELYRTTSQRDRIAIHPEGYYRKLFEVAELSRGSAAKESRPFDLRLWIARHEGAALAAIITLFCGEEATYLYGASSDEGRNLMPAYALQWAAMRAAKASGCARYDLFGIPPSDDPAHPMAGLYRFKTGFGGSIAHRAGSWDFPLMRLAYACFRAAEGARSWWYKGFKKRLGRSGKSAS
jgi:lipid II:glycine glycyltransferase (peptidoglycan interpeptide bridge formation enzyme)